MLSLEHPPLSVAGLTVWADHADPNVFYHSAPNPQLVREGGQPMLDVFSYAVELKNTPLAGTTIPDELGAGFLTMGVECALSAADRSAAVQALARRLDRDADTLALVPIPYTAGTVSVIALDAATGAAAGTAPAATPGRPRFVESVVGAGAPSLLGSLRSIFSLALSQDGVTFLERLYADGAAPVGVVYSLSFLGMRPSVQAHVHADVSRIYSELGGRASVGCPYIRAEVEGLITHLAQTGAVTIDLTSEAVGAEKAAAEELALSVFKDRIIQELFQPAPTLPAVPTVPGMPSAQQSAIVTLSLKAKSEDELRTVDYDFTERSPEVRTDAPQAFVATLLTPEELAARTHHVDLADDFFELLDVLVAGPSAEEFTALGLRSATVDLCYGAGEEASSGVAADRASLVFRPGGPTDLRWAVRRRGRRTLGYTAALTYDFDRRAGVDGDALTYAVPPRPHTGRVLSVRPLDDVGVLDVEVDTGRLDPEVRDVDVDLVCTDPVTGFTAQQHLRISPAAPGPREARSWQVRTATTSPLAYVANSTLTFTDGAVFALPPVTSRESLLRVDAPFRGTRSLLIQPNVTSADVSSMTVEVHYTDDVAGYARQFRRVMTPPPPTDPTAPPPATTSGATPLWPPVTLSWPIVDPAKQQLLYRVTTAAGGVIDAGDWTPTSDPSILVGDLGHRGRRVEIRLIGPPLADVGLDAVQVRVGATGSTDADAVSAFFDTTTAVSQPLTVAAPPGAPAGFRYQVTAFRADGTQHVGGWQPSGPPLIVISTRTA